MCAHVCVCVCVCVCARVCMCVLPFPPHWPPKRAHTAAQQGPPVTFAPLLCLPPPPGAWLVDSERFANTRSRARTLTHTHTKQGGKSLILTSARSVITSRCLAGGTAAHCFHTYAPTPTIMRASACQAHPTMRTRARAHTHEAVPLPSPPCTCAHTHAAVCALPLPYLCQVCHHLQVPGWGH